MRLSGEQLKAVQYLEEVYTSASRAGQTRNISMWINPDNRTDRYYVSLLDSILNRVPYESGRRGKITDVQRLRYKDAINDLLPAIETSARAWAWGVLRRQEQKLASLVQVVNDDVMARGLTAAAKEVKEAARNETLRLLTREEMIEVTGKKDRRGTVVNRLKRVAYMNYVKQGGNQYLESDGASPRSTHR